MRIAVYGLWHLGCVTAGCIAAAGHHVVGLDPDVATVTALQDGQPPLFEPGLAELIVAEQAAGRLIFTSDPAAALEGVDVLWVTFDTPVNERDEADVAAVRNALEAIADFIPRGTLVLVSSQVPVGFTRSLRRDWLARDLRYAYSPENLRLGKALGAFRTPERVIVGVDTREDEAVLAALFAPFSSRIEWMSIESAEMTKHALNAFLATSVAFINELARLCEIAGADAKEVERGLKSDGRIGQRAYLAPGAAFAGGTLARDLNFLVAFGERNATDTPLLRGVLASNRGHASWMHDKIRHFTEKLPTPVVAVLGLTYKPGTNTLRRSASLELCSWLYANGMRVQAHDPVVNDLPEPWRDTITLCSTIDEALTGADVAVLATEWPEYRALRTDDFREKMRQPIIIDQNGYLADHLAGVQTLTYVAIGRVFSRRDAAYG